MNSKVLSGVLIMLVVLIVPGEFVSSLDPTGRYRMFLFVVGLIGLLVGIWETSKGK
jgi:hypothetical protein